MTADVDELAALQGAWRVVSLEMDGAPVAPALFGEASIKVSGNRFESLGMGATYVGEITLDAGASVFCLVFAEGPEAGRQNHGLYRLEGDDWRFCLDMTGGPAPEDFSTRPGSGRALQTLRRIRD